MKTTFIITDRFGDIASFKANKNLYGDLNVFLEIISVGGKLISDNIYKMPKEELKEEILYSLGDEPVFIEPKKKGAWVEVGSFRYTPPETREEYEIKLLSWKIKKQIADKLLKKL